MRRRKKRERGKKGERGRKKRKRERKKGEGKRTLFPGESLNNVIVLKNLPQHLKNVGKGRKKGEKDVRGEGKRIFWGRPWRRFSTMQCYALKTFPNTLRMKAREEKKGERKKKEGKGKKKDVQGREDLGWGRKGRS